MVALTPGRQTLFATKVCTGLNGLVQSVEQQVDVGRVVDIGLDNEGITASVQRRRRAFFEQLVTGPDYLLVDAIEPLGGEEAQIV